MFVLYQTCVRSQGKSLINLRAISPTRPSSSAGPSSHPLPSNCRSVPVEIQSVDPAVLLAYVRDPRLRRQPATGDSLEQLTRRELSSVLVDMLLQPAEQIS